MRKPLTHVFLNLDDVPMNLDGGGGLCCPDDPLDEIMECVPIFDDPLLSALDVDWSPPPPPPRRSEEPGHVTCGGGDARPPQDEEFGGATCGAGEVGGGAAGAVVVVEDACELDVPWSAPRASAETTPSASPNPWPPSSMLFPAAAPRLSQAEIAHAQQPPWPPSPAPPPRPSQLLCAWTPRSQRGKRRRRPAASSSSQWRCPFPLHVGDELPPEDNKDEDVYKYNQRNDLTAHINGDCRCSLPPAPRRVFVPSPSPSPDHQFHIVSYGNERPSNGDGDGDFKPTNAAAGAKRQVAVSEARRRAPPQKRNRQANRTCAHCHRTETAQWRAGPAGPGTLCNACGLRFKLHGEIPEEYRPSNSDGFVDGEHSNRHKRVLKIREEKEKKKKALVALVSAATAAGDPYVSPCKYELV